MSASNRQRACAVADMHDGDMLRLETTPPIAVYRVGDEFFATDATCTHMDSCLTEGYLDGHEIECVLHGARFCVRTGRALSLPATIPLRVIKVSVSDDTVYVDIPVDADKTAQQS